MCEKYRVVVYLETKIDVKFGRLFSFQSRALPKY